MQVDGAAWVPQTDDPDAVYDAVGGWVERQGLSLYPHQDEAIIELLGGSNVILSTPTGSGKSLVAMAAHAAALAGGRVSFYTAPIKALVNEKFFALCEVFGPENVGMLTGDASVNADAPIICCTAEVLANIALREGRGLDKLDRRMTLDPGSTLDRRVALDPGSLLDRRRIGLVVMDEFHFYAEPDRGWAWQVPLLELTETQFVLMSATLGDVTDLAADLTRRNGRTTAVVDDAERPVPLVFSWAMTHLTDTLAEIVESHQAPAYVVHFTQAAAVEHATSLLASAGAWSRLRSTDEGKRSTDEGRRSTDEGERSTDDRTREAINQRLVGFRFGAGFGKTLQKLVRNGIGVHHAGMLPRYRRLVEQLAQAGLLVVICGTDTLGVGINVPIRTVLFTGLAKFDGNRQRILRTREFLQIAGRAGRAGFDTVGYVVVQAPPHVIDNAIALKKIGDDPKKQRGYRRKKPADGEVVWSEETFDKLVAGTPEQLVSRMRVDNAMLVNVLSREEDAFPVLRRLLTDNHESPATRRRLARRALRLARSLLRSGVLTRLDELDEYGRRYVLTVDLPDDFALNQPLSHFALAAFDVLDPEADDHTLDLLSVVEAVLEAPRQILAQQQYVARGEAVAEMKADGIEYEERMALLDEITWPMPLRELLEATYAVYRETHPWLPEDALSPKSVVREMYEQGMGFTDFVARYQLARSEGLVLRYLTDAYRTLRQTVPDHFRTPELEELIEWLSETVRQTDSSLLDEWEALTDPEAVHRHAVELAEHRPPTNPRPISQQKRPFGVMIRNAMFARVQLVARDDLDGLMALERATADRTDPPGEVVMTRSAWDGGIEAYYAEHDEVLLDGDARGPELLRVAETGRSWTVVQTLHDPEGHHDWVIEALVDIDASDELGELVLVTQAFRRLDG